MYNLCSISFDSLAERFWTVQFQFKGPKSFQPSILSKFMNFRTPKFVLGWLRNDHECVCFGQLDSLSRLSNVFQDPDHVKPRLRPLISYEYSQIVFQWLFLQGLILLSLHFNERNTFPLFELSILQLSDFDCSILCSIHPS